ncbi:MAG: succinylglutamate desuccinylase/aspartoacylase family protein [Alphaproteobacteria bacterium]|nr:succinylglutamate desuccinylase/aspartoacylase family protein [Alphaproteobacteria bacterium]
MVQVYNFKGNKDGAKLLVLGAIHGNEVAGPLAISRLMQELEAGKIKLVSGTLTLLPIANPEAHQKDIRQIEENLNRVINQWETPNTYEKKLGVEVAKLIEACDYMLDVHSTHNAGEIAFSFLDYATTGNLKIVEALDVDYVLSGWPDVYGSQDEIVDFSTERYVNFIGKNGLTLESGYHKDPAAIDLAYQSIVNLLKNLKMIEGSFEKKEKRIVKMTDIVIKNKEGHLADKFKHFDFLKKGTLIAQCDDGEQIFADKDCYMIIPNHHCELGAEWYYLGVLL